MSLNIMKKYREQNSLTQEDLAKLLFCTQGAVAAWENGIRTPNKEQANKIIKVIGPDIISEIYPLVAQQTTQPVENQGEN